MELYAIQYYHERELVTEIIKARSKISAELKILREKGMVYFIDSWLVN